ncbi:MAG: PhzF family phenazine biosynthesis protein [Chloroflexi bacterium]|nr:PhzF family phenazine biosynthesis protein [Chloroflexota bacterium]
MPRSYPFEQVDVFTDRVFGGNQLAVFLEPDGLSDAQMQAIALEMNISETTFVFPSTRPDCAARVRIFTPRRELPFAGHPTVGTAWAISRRRPDLGREFCLEEGVGPVPVTLEGETVWMQHRDPEWSAPLDNRATVAAALGLQEVDLLDDHPLLIGSTGASFLYVPVRDPGTVDRVQPAVESIPQISSGEASGVFVFAPDLERGPNRVYSRMLGSQALGVGEDPATGSASGPLAAYVAEHQLVKLADPIELLSLQGNKMGRPSLIHMRLQLRDGKAHAIQVGGRVVAAFDAVLHLPS